MEGVQFGPLGKPFFDFGKFAKDIRDKRNNETYLRGKWVSIRALAYEMGISPPTLSRAMKGKPVSVDSILCINDWTHYDFSRYVQYEGGRRDYVIDGVSPEDYEAFVRALDVLDGTKEKAGPLDFVVANVEEAGAVWFGILQRAGLDTGQTYSLKDHLYDKQTATLTLTLVKL